MNSQVVTDEILGILQFLRDAEALKNVYRTSWTSGGQPESTATHTWRLCLSALLFAKQFPEVNAERLLKICIIHDLGEAIGGDIPAIHQDANAPKAAQERQDLLTLLQPLTPTLQKEILDLWDEYEAATTPEAKVAKALDKMETLMQHNQGANPPDFDYLFNIGYARQYTDAVPLIAEIRELLDAETKENASSQGAAAPNKQDDMACHIESQQKRINQGDIFWIHPEILQVGELGVHIHPYVVIQDDLLNHSRVDSVVVCALTSNLKQANEPGNVLLDVGEANLPKQSAVVVSKVSAVGKLQLGDYIGSLSEERINQIMAGMRFQQRSFFAR